MKAVMLSIRPQWCEKIFNGEKTIEVRKTRPKIETPFEVLVYCTMPKERWSVGHQIFYNDTLYTLPTGELKIGDALELRADWPRKYNEDNFLNGKVIGSFVCDRITNIHCYSDTKDTNIYEPSACLTGEEICEYLNYEDGYGWHITEPKLFDKPRELREFRTPFPFSKHCLNCEINENRTTKGFNAEYCSACSYFKGNLTRPPQSYYFVEIDEI